MPLAAKEEAGAKCAGLSGERKSQFPYLMPEKEDFCAAARVGRRESLGLDAAKGCQLCGWEMEAVEAIAATR